MYKPAIAAAALVLLAASPAAAEPCPKDTLGKDAVRIVRDGLTVAYRTEPAQLAVGGQFSVEVVACAGGEAPADIRVDATMPHHGHGMNYTPAVRRVAPGHAVFDGLVMHMPGHWVFTFDVFAGNKRTRLVQKVTIRR